MAMDALASALGGGAGAGAPGAGAPPDAGAPEPAPEGGGAGEFTNSLEALDAAEEALHAFIQLDPDEPDRAAAAQALQVVLKLKAGNQTSVASGDMKSLARSLQGGNQLG